MAKHTNLTSLFSDIADAIRAKKGTTGTIVADNFPDEIAGIEAGSDINLSVVTAAASDVVSPKVFINSEGEPMTGTIPTKTSSNLTASGATVTVPAGYYASNATKSISTVTQATPSITVSSSGLVTATSTQSAGYVSSGTKSATKQLTTKSAATITPGTSDQTIAAGTYLTGDQTIKAKNGLFASATVGSRHSETITFSVTGINNRYPEYILLYSSELTGELHGSEDVCTAIVDLYVYNYSSNAYVGYCRYNGAYMPETITTSHPVTVSVSSDSITLEDTEHGFYGEYKAAIIC